MGEVELGKLAQDKASDPAIKSFAAMMVKDHSQANEELKALAASKGVSLPAGAGAGSAAKKTELKVLSGNAFDKSYVTNQVKAHQETVALLQKEIASGRDADAKMFAQKVLPTVEKHLNAIEKIADGMGISHN
jgi:putative membrane protein